MMTTSKLFCYASFLRSLVFAGFLSYSLGAVHAQESPDFSVWTGIKLRKEFSGRLSAYAKFEYRQAGDLLYPRNYFGQIGGSYRLIHGLELHAAYRWDERYRLKNDAFFTNHRWQVAAVLYKRFGRFKVELRNQFQVRRSLRGGDKYPWRIFQRERLMLSYNWPRLPFKTSGFTEVWLPYNLTHLWPVAKVRLGLTQEFKLGEHHEWTVGHYFNFDQRPNRSEREAVLLLRYTFTF